MHRGDAIWPILGNGILDATISAKQIANSIDSDGIARVHGMANVQAEELVE